MAIDGADIAVWTSTKRRWRLSLTRWIPGGC